MTGIPYNSDIWIKYSTGVTEAEAILQQFVNENRMNALPVTYLVMERVRGEALTAKEDDIVLENIAAAVRHLWELPSPQASIGPLAGQEPHVDANLN
ncbi:uncharacterized protein GIQ15_04494 [Arthroderma uncinatum]|uniref:uncharacterized protein n=1 Tax=Arthroderma uncinatum TaxID=74035 RepID=UPI00144AF8E5|nr:uncharacterized protein GIQ15_04494 [Arthroderma uncinatum]KAF3481735.1 hypothetical protein GIQ15_04494 [Arthroderma uncinatum]